MPLFTPETTIRFLSNTGIDDYNKPNFTSNAAMVGWLQGKTAFTKTGLSYQRADERQYTQVDLNYYDLLSCDAMMWQNAGTSDHWLVANITDLEWVNPNCTRVYFKVDAYCSFCGNIVWADSYCLVEREHVQDDWSGGVPNWSTVGMDEGFSLTPDFIVNNIDRTFTPDTYIVLSPYTEDGTPDFGGSIQYGIYDGINALETSNSAEVNAYLNTLATGDESRLQNVIGVISVPHEMLDASSGTITLNKPWTAYAFNNAKCYTSQFCSIVIESMLGGSKNFKPELMGPASGAWVFNWRGYRVGMSCGVTVRPATYANIQTGNAPDLSYTIEGVPQGAFIGNAFAQYMSTNYIRLISDALNAAAGVGNAVITGVGNVASGKSSIMGAIGEGIISGLDSAKGVITEVMEARKSSAFIGGNTSFSDVNLAVANQGYGFFARVYIANPVKLLSIDAFFDRYGYKVMKLKTPNINTRPCWNYVKTSEAHIAGTFPYVYKQQVENMLNAGCTFWNVGARDIGDYSNPVENKG